MSATSSPLDRFLSAFTLVSRIPVRLRFSWDASALDFHLPLVGVPVAALAAAVLWLARASGLSPFLAALACLCVQYFAFNLFHLDGLMDSADALLGSGDRERRLAILKDSRIGVYAFFVGFAYLSAKTAFLAEAAERLPTATPAEFAAIFAYPICGRAAGALVPALSKPARTDGLGAAASGARAYRTFGGTTAAALLLWAVAALASAVSNDGDFASLAAAAALSWPIIVLSALAAASFTARSYKRTVGGYTGDAQGAAVEFGELACLGLSLAAAGIAL